MFTLNILSFLRKDRFISINFFLGLVLCLFFWAFLIYFVFYGVKANTVALHYTIYFGINWIGAKSYIFIYPLMASFFLAVNTGIAVALYFKERIISYFLMGASTFLIILSVVAGLLVYLINI